MIKISNGLTFLVVTKGAFESIFKPQGYAKVLEADATKIFDEENVGTVENEYTELLEKPLSSWTKNEVKTFSEAKEIDLTGTKNVGEAKARIKEYLKKH